MIRDLDIEINRKVLLRSIKIMLSAKLYENKLVIVDNLDLEVPKTRVLHHFLKPFKQRRLLFVTAQNPCENFSLAIRNLPFKKETVPNEITATKMIQSDFVIISKQGLMGKLITM